MTIEVEFVPLNGAPGHEDCPSLAYADLDISLWYHPYTDYVLANKLMVGYGNNLFGPDDTLSRAMLAQIIYNMEGRPGVTGDSPFTDVAPGAWYADAVTWAQINGVVKGYGNGRYG